MRKDWIWALGLGVAVVACLEDKGGDSGGSDGSDGSGADGSGADGSGADGSGADGSGADGSGADGSGADGSGGSSGGGITALAEAVCGMYDDCGIMEYYFGDMATCVDTVASYYESYGCTPGSTFDECIAEIEAGGCDYYYYGGSGSCYYALECSGGYYYYYYYYYYY
jgi:hypothetical protein